MKKIKWSYIFIYFILLVFGLSINLFSSDDGKFVAYSDFDDKIYYSGDYIDLDQYTPVKDGYVFKGWTKTGNCDEIIHSDIIEPGVTYKACWIKSDTTTNNNSGNNKSRISALSTQGGVLKSGNVYIGDTVNLDEVVVLRSGYRFEGWYTASVGGNKLTGVQKLSSVVYAHWKPYQVTIYYNGNGGTWCGNKGTVYKAASNGDVLKNNTKYSIIRDYGKVISSIYGVANVDNVEAICFERNGYIAVSGSEWNTKANGSGTSFNHDNTKLTAYDVAMGSGCDLAVKNCSVTLYANWMSSNVPAKLSITLRANGGTIDNKSSSIVRADKNSSVNLNQYTPVRSGYVFDGWYSKASGGDKVTNVKVRANVIYYAHWRRSSTVNPAIKLNQSNVVLKINGTYSLKATVSNSKSSVKWTSSNTGVATVNANGKVTAKKNGTATITATLSNDSSVKASVKVTVNSNAAKPTIKISKTSVSLKSGDSYTLVTTVTNATNDVKWTSSNTNVATVNANGKVTAKKNGTATITATLSSNSKIKVTSKVTVRKIKVLFVGNSLTYTTHSSYSPKGSPSNPFIPRTLVEMAKKDGIYFEYTGVLKAGGLLDTHWNDSSNRSKFNSSYDYAVIQPHIYYFVRSGSTSAQLNKQISAGVSIANALRAKNPNIKIFVRRLWGYRDLNDIKTNYNSLSEEFKSVYDGVTKIGNMMGNVTFIDDGNAFYDIINNYKNINLYFDQQHQNIEGAYLASLCIYSNVFDKNPNQVSYLPSINYKGSKYSVKSVSTLKSVAYNNCYNTVNYYNGNNSVNVYLNANGGTINNKNIQVIGVSKNSNFNLNNYVPVRTGYVFAGWYTNSTSGNKVSGSQGISANTNYYAHWTAKTISVNFYRSTNNSDTTKVTQKFTYGKSGQKFASTGFSASGYTLVGWSLSRGGAVNYSLLSGVEDSWIDRNYPSINLYAVWTKNNEHVHHYPGININNFISMLDYMSKTVASDYKSSSKKTWVYSNEETLLETFDEERGLKQPYINCSKLVNWALYDIGLWTNVSQGVYGYKSNTVIYKPGANSANTKNLIEKYFDLVIINKSQKDAVKNNLLKRGDIVFWADINHTNVYLGNNKWYDAGQRNYGQKNKPHGYSDKKGNYYFKTFEYTGNVHSKIYAVYRWKSANTTTNNNTSNNSNVKYTVTLNANGGTLAQKSIVVNNGSYVNLDNYVPTRSGYKFLGWYTENNDKTKNNKATDGTKVSGNKKIISNVTYYAYWTFNIKTLKTISLKSSSKYITVTGGRGIGQGFCVLGNYMVALKKTSDDSKASIHVYNKNTKKLIKIFDNNQFGHGNDMACNPDNGNVYVVDAGGGKNNGRAYWYFNLNNALKSGKLGYVEANTANTAMTGLSYDSSTKNFYALSGSTKVTVLDQNMKEIKVLKIPVLESSNEHFSPQGFFVKNGIVMIPRFRDPKSSVGRTIANRIHFYRLSDMAYLGTYVINADYKIELESLDYFGSGNKYALYFNYIGTSYAVVHNADITVR